MKLQIKRYAIFLTVLVILLLVAVRCANAPATPTSTLQPHIVVQNDSDARVAVWAHLRDLVRTDKGQTLYNAALDNIWRADCSVCFGYDICPEDSWYFSLQLYVDKGSGTLLLPPYAVISTIMATGRQVVYFGWIVKSDGEVYPCNPYAIWLEKALQE